jgi:hypothetical protein
MAKGISFNFGANARKKKTGTKKKTKKASKRKSGNKSNAWRQYVGSNAPIPD